MALFSIDLTSRAMSVVTPTTFAGQGIQEPRDLRPLLAANLEKLDPESHWFVLSEEFSGWEGSNRAIDILAVVRDGDEAHLVVIELKRTEDGGHMDLQAIRYAAMVAPFNFEDLVRIYTDYLKRQRKPAEGARATLLQYLGGVSEGTISVSNRPRIVLVSWGFSREISATVLWLNSMGLDVRCFIAQPYHIEKSLYLDIEQIIPLPSAQEYEFSLRDKQIQRADVESEKVRSRAENSLKRLMNAGVLLPGTKIVLVRNKNEVGVIPDDAITAVFYDFSHKGIAWSKFPDGARYSLGKLTDKILDNYAPTSPKRHAASSWVIDGQSKSLWEMADDLESRGGVAVTLPGVPIPPDLSNTVSATTPSDVLNGTLA